jgi:hypothetical protein
MRCDRHRSAEGKRAKQRHHQINSGILRMFKFCAVLILSMQIGSSIAAPVLSTEARQVHVIAEVQYRCHPKSRTLEEVDERTGLPCENKSTTSVLVDKLVNLKLAVRPNPGNSMEADDSWSDQFDHMGRKYTVSVIVSKSTAPQNYNIRIAAFDDEPSPRQSAVFANVRRFSDLNPIQIEMSSAGKKEEIRFTVTVRPVK